MLTGINILTFSLAVHNMYYKLMKKPIFIRSQFYAHEKRAQTARPYA